MTGEGILECCGVLTSEPGSGKPSLGLHYRLFLTSSTAARREEGGPPTDVERAESSPREVLQELRSRRAAGSRPRPPGRLQVIRLMSCPGGAEPSPASGLPGAQLLPAETPRSSGEGVGEEPSEGDFRSGGRKSASQAKASGFPV